jgi:Winged helix DNA-binding domain
LLPFENRTTRTHPGPRSPEPIDDRAGRPGAPPDGGAGRRHEVVTAVTDWGALGEYAKDLGKVRRSPNPCAGRATRSRDGGDGDSDLDRVPAFRARATHLDRRLAAGEHVEAAFAGRQDSAPRAGLVALHARVQGVGPGAWEDPELVQVWLRGAGYVVPRRHVDVFTVGGLPRPPAQRSALQRLAGAVVKVLDGRAMTVRQVAELMADLPASPVLRLCPVTGKVHIRWDARTPVLLPAPAGPASGPAAGYELDQEQARRELARRSLAWLGPAGAAQFAAWAGVRREDAEETWRCLDQELMVVPLSGVEATILAKGEEAFSADGTDVRAVRLLPMGDPYLYARAALPVETPPEELSDRLRRDGASPRLVNRLTGRVLPDGRLASSWGRSGSQVTLAAWQPMAGATRDVISGEVHSMSVPVGHAVTMKWLA